VSISPEQLRELVQKELGELGFSFDNGRLILPAVDKAFLRRLHIRAQTLELQKNQEWLCHKLPKYHHLFANGSDVVPETVQPELVPVTQTWHSDLFRVARLLWSLPYSKGYGRRLRYLLMDKSNGKLIGIFALQSPPLSFPARDNLFNYPEGRKTWYVNQTMDIHTLGAIPPYTRLLGGKLVALAAAANEVRKDYQCKYEGRLTEMHGRLLPAHLVALTTTSAFGRSSLYNRLKYHDYLIAQPLGYTKGYGSFHLMELYPFFRQFLEAQGISTRGGFGTGPRRKWQTMVRALERIGFSSELLKHGVQREAFLFPLVENLKDYLEGKGKEPIYRDLPFRDLVRFWQERWLLPRAERVDGWHQWDRQQITEDLILTGD
jgi:hypothetical protein